MTDFVFERRSCDVLIGTDAAECMCRCPPIRSQRQTYSTYGDWHKLWEGSGLNMIIPPELNSSSSSISEDESRELSVNPFLLTSPLSCCEISPRDHASLSVVHLCEENAMLCLHPAAAGYYEVFYPGEHIFMFFFIVCSKPGQFEGQVSWQSLI